ncbi:helicase HerA-like domain-containing protein [Thermopetrobacter sp. TC1]|uniref:helicase HerA-like domain-containing protein n=1 Tax=Thermopetrobacter sp. TC1 TaxID=1495045 RepID=UPI00056DC1CF|nr:helicase HerA-like domain-containing protein [Thermopetrobacter sp. TC1]
MTETSASNRVFIGSAFDEKGAPLKQWLNLPYANRHGLITGATGTGKTVSLQILAEGLSDAGVPVFAADVKGDLAGLSQPGEANDKILERARKIGFDDYGVREFPVIFWDLFGEQGHPVRTTISDMGPLLLSRLMNLTEAQEGVLNIAFKVADEEGLLLLDLKDLRALLKDLADRGKELVTEYGTINKRSVGAILRRLVVLEEQGGEMFFGEPSLDIRDFMRTTPDGRGYINILAADRLMQSPKVYATFLLWLLSELFEELPEVGDPEKPKLVFFFDEAHLLFKNAPVSLVEKIEQVVKLIRSKGVGVYFVTQNPLDIPDSVLAQLGNRIQHALRAYTPREQRAVKAAAETFRQNPAFDTADVITKLGVGEALVSTLQKKGVPSMVQRTLIRPPSSRMGPITEAERKRVILDSPVYGIYEESEDRISAFETLKKRAEEKALAEERAREEEERRKAEERAAREEARARSYASRRMSTTERFIKSLAGSIGTQLGRAIIRGILGGLLRGRR